MSNVRYGSLSVMTFELLETIFDIPKGSKLVHVETDFARDRVAFKFQSEEEIEGFTFETHEGQEYRSCGRKVLEYTLKGMMHETLDALEALEDGQEGDRTLELLREVQVEREARADVEIRS